MGEILPRAEEVVERLVARCRERAVALDFTTFVLGVSVPRAHLAAPEPVQEAWKSAVKRGAGLRIGLEWLPLGRRAEFRRPEVVFVYDPDADRIRTVIRPLLIGGRYLKLARGVSQTRSPWRCPSCEGAGCAECVGTGKRSPESVEELLGEPALRALDARGYALHGMGREDVDVLCLGRGRPFVLEVLAPGRRQADLGALAQAIEAHAAGRVALSGPLRWVGPEVIPRLKGSTVSKSYRAVCQVQGPTPDAEVLARLSAALSGATLEQRTPLRVSHRRSDLVRRRRVLSFQAAGGEGGRFEALITSQSGTYIKELISGDCGRTVPSVASLLGRPCLCAELDVLEVACGDELWAPDPGVQV